MHHPWGPVRCCSILDTDHFCEIGPEVWPVYLVSLSRSSDIAVFELSQAAVTSGNYPPDSVPSSALSSSLTEPTTNTSGRSFKDTDQSYLRLFAAYYPANNILVERTDLSPKRKEFARQANIPFAWDLWCEERSNLDPAAAKNPGVSLDMSYSVSKTRT